MFGALPHLFLVRKPVPRRRQRASFDIHDTGESEVLEIWKTTNAGLYWECCLPPVSRRHDISDSAGATNGLAERWAFLQRPVASGLHCTCDLCGHFDNRR